MRERALYVRSGYSKRVVAFVISATTEAPAVACRLHAPLKFVYGSPVAVRAVAAMANGSPTRCSVAGAEMAKWVCHSLQRMVTIALEGGARYALIPAGLERATEKV